MNVGDEGAIWKWPLGQMWADYIRSSISVPSPGPGNWMEMVMALASLGMDAAHVEVDVRRWVPLDEWTAFNYTLGLHPHTDLCQGVLVQGKIRAVLRDKAIVELDKKVETVLQKEFVSSRMAPDQVEDLNTLLRPGQVITARILLTIPKVNPFLQQALETGGAGHRDNAVVDAGDDAFLAREGLMASLRAMNRLVGSTMHDWCPAWEIGPYR